MSWSINLFGTPERICVAMEAYALQLGNPSSSQSRREFDDAKPHLEALVAQNVDTHVVPGGILVQVNANGHATFASDGTVTARSVNVKIDRVYGMLV